MRRTVTLAATLLAGWTVIAAAQQPTVLPMGPARERGASVTPAYEGWYQNDDGSFSMLIGYYNRNSKEALTIPVGPNNKIEPGDPDQGQPTFFEMGRQWGVFVIKVPKDFGDKVIRWTIVANGETQSVPFSLNKGYPITPFKELGMGNQPPTLWFGEGAAKVTGPPVGVAGSFSGVANQPVRDHVLCRRCEREGRQVRSTWPRSRCTSIAVPGTSPTSAPALPVRQARRSGDGERDVLGARRILAARASE